MMEWCRLWHDMPNDPKFRTIARLSESRTSDVISVFVHLMVSASTNAGERGRTQPNAEDLGSALDLETERVEAILRAMQGRVLYENSLTGWKKRQPIREDGSAERSANWREQQRLRESEKQANARERTRTQTTTRRDGDETETRRDGEVLVVNDLLPATEEIEIERTNGRTHSVDEIHVNGNGSVRPSVATVFSPESQMKTALHGYMRMAGTPFQQPFKEPDDRIVKRCLAAIGNAELGEVFDFLSDRFRNCEQSPRHPNGPRKYSWFVTVLAAQFGGHA